MTPSEYAAKAQAKFAHVIEKSTKKNLFLVGKRIFLITGDHECATRSSRSKMDLVVKRGGTLITKYDPELVTHIITLTPSKVSALKALGLKTLAEIPDHIPTLTWDWVTTRPAGKLDHEFMHVAFGRFDADSSKAAEYSEKRKKAKIASDEQDIAEDHSLIDGSSAAFLPNAPPALPLERQRTALRSVGSKGKEPYDPLSEFYAKAKSDAEAAWPHYEESDSDDPVDDVVKSKKKSVFTCDQKGANVGKCVNQDVVDKLKELAGLHEAKPSDEDKWRVFSYNKTIRALRNYPKRIQSYSEARAIKGVGDKTAQKIMEIIQTGSLERINYERTEDVEAVNVFKGIYGVGPKTAYMWYASGCRTLDDVKQRKGGITVSDVQEIGIRFYDDINMRMPREECGAIFAKIKPIGARLDSKLFIEIMAERNTRGKLDCGDIDILITRATDDGKTHKGSLLKNLLRELHLRGILTEDLAVPDDFNDLELTYRGLCRLDSSKPRRRIGEEIRSTDILCVPYKSRGAALLYYTGDDIFNRTIRYKAGAMGYSLNQRGLYSNVIRDRNDRKRKLHKGTIIASETEEEIFRILEVPWQEPHERVRS
ncbi:Nucleotidyltransferase [Schizopora paradoxa]|uniref:DNA polymerase n=1 Tax=Schizopora paradoxa TaxID=27342 RepID=A0A0H2RUR7_9AGAM|nr:Nucleotidyltransferase [Schizopora paradoxa]